MASSRRIDFTINGHNNAKNALNSAANDVKKLANDVKAAGSKMTMSNGFNKIVTEAKQASTKIKDFFNGMGGVIASAFAGFSLSSIMQDAGAAESKWNRIAVATGATSENLAQQKVTVRALADQYGVVNGTLSGIYETNLRFYGDQQRSLFLTQGIAATSKRTGTDMETIQQALMSGELGRNKALQRSVLTEAQRNKYLADGKLTEDEINQIMQENIDLVGQNTKLTSDAESAYSRMKSSIDSMVVTIGSDLAPVITTMADIISKAADAFKTVDKATGGVLGSITGIVLAAVALGAPLVWAGGVLSNMAKSAAATAISLSEAAISSKVINTSSPGGGTVKGTATTTITSALAGLGGGSAAVGAGVGLAIVAGIVAGIYGGYQIIDAAIQGAIKPFTQYGKYLEKDENGIYQEKTWTSAIPAMEGFNQQVGKIMNNAGPSAVHAGQMIYTAFATTGAQGIKAFKDAAANGMSSVRAGWNGLKSLVGRGMTGIAHIYETGKAYVQAAWNGLKSLVGRGASGLVSIWSSGIEAVTNAWNNLKNSVSQGVTGVVKFLTGGGPAGPAGPTSGFDNMNLKYESYQGSKHNPWTSDGMSGNCVDMSLGLISAAGTGQLVNGTWNGSPHVWANIGGRNYDPARKALEGTWTPPARGPGGMGEGINIYGDVYGFDDFANKVEQATNKKISRVF